MGPPLGLGTAKPTRHPPESPLRGEGTPSFTPVAALFRECTRDVWHAGSRLEPRGEDECGEWWSETEAQGPRRLTASRRTWRVRREEGAFCVRYASPGFSVLTESKPSS